MELNVGDHVKLSPYGIFPEGDLYTRKECLERTWEIADLHKSGAISIREVGGGVGMMIKKENVGFTLVKVAPVSE